VLHACTGGTVFGTPISEYQPRHLVHGGFAIIGDAAHVVSPMTGRGFTTALEDADAVAACLANGVTPAATALKGFERQRLTPARELAGTSIRWSSNYVAFADAANRRQAFRPDTPSSHE
jgi:2-polyprenyl-6-methoxyphenol hydroxylase-like FAD-dependent oxidoreductase